MNGSNTFRNYETTFHKVLAIFNTPFSTLNKTL
jgi:hypothetical protein